MKSRRIPGKSLARSERGFALIAVLALAALIAAFLISSALNRSSADVSNEREQRTMDTLRQAKAALIGYAAATDWRLQVSGSTTSYFQPGALPCPDASGNGTSDCASGAADKSMIGRLPWKTMRIDDLRDASGEQLWYAVSHDFRKAQCVDPSPPPQPPPPPPLNPLGCTRINSDTQGQLSATGTVSADKVVAVVIAPGEALKGQVRPSTAVGSYLESFSPGNGVNFSFTTNAKPDGVLNDRIVVITQAELMAAVEPVVAARIERDIAPRVKAYFDTFKAYPFPAPFAGGAAPSNPARAWTEYKGSTTQGGGLPQVSGLLPLTTAAGYLTWRTSSITVTQIPGGTGTGKNGPSNPGACTFPGGDSSSPFCTIESMDCSSSTSTLINCRIDYSETDDEDDRPAIALRAVLNNAALSFPKPIGPTDLTMTDKNGDPVALDQNNPPHAPPLTGPWSWSDVPTSTPTLFHPSVDYTASSDGSAVVVFRGRLQNQADPTQGTGGRVRIRIPVPTAYDDITNIDPDANPDIAWFTLNDWFRQTYYAVSAGFLPGGGQACTALPAPPLPPLSASPPFYCLQVNNLRASYTPPNNNKRAILVLAGRSMNGVTRPTGSVADYFENANLTAANGTSPFVYEHRVGLPTSINDRVVVVPPSP